MNRGLNNYLGYFGGSNTNNNGVMAPKTLF